jgi:PAS domain S-box-containing protein
MLTYLALAFSIALQIILIVQAIRLIKVAQSRTTWILITISFVLMAVRKSTNLLVFIYTNSINYYESYNYWADVIISILMVISLFWLERMIKTHKKNENERYESEVRFRTLFSNSSDELFLADLSGKFIEVNKEVCNRLGYTREELLVMNFSDLKTPKYADKVKENIELIIKNGTHIYESEHLSKDGKIIYLEMSSRIIRYKGKSVIFTIARDITERKDFERKLLSGVIEAEDRERQRFAKEMHDGLGPLLSTIKIYVNEIYTEDIEPLEKQKLVKYTNELIDDAISNIRTISNNLMPSVIRDYGLIKGIDSLCKKINLTNKILVNFTTTSYNKRLEKNIEIVLYRITEELLNNTLKHASAENVNIRIQITDNKVIFNYYDDGVGCNVDDAFINSKQGMGLKNIISRVKSVNANYYFDSKYPGFSFSMELYL